jgi:hypothetical protein
MKIKVNTLVFNKSPSRDYLYITSFTKPHYRFSWISTLGDHTDDFYSDKFHNKYNKKDIVTDIFVI